MKNWRMVVHRLVLPVANRDGQALVFFGLFSLSLLALFALAVDIGVVLNARSEAQRAADAGALAGAAVFTNVNRTPDQSYAVAPDTAMSFVMLNTVGGAPPDSVHVSFVNWPSEWRVRVQVWGRTPGLFARFLGRSLLPVYAEAEAHVGRADGATCVKPFALPDMWISGLAPNTDPNYDPRETAQTIWGGSFNPARGDRYKPWDGTLTDFDATGYGAPARNDIPNWQGNSYRHDNGRKIIFKTGTHGPDQSWMEAPVGALNGADHMIIKLPPDSTGFSPILDRNGNPVPCDGNANGGGAALARANVCMCNNKPLPIGGQAEKEPGNKASIAKSLRFLMDADPNVSWDPINKRVIDEFGNTVTNSPRIIKVALYDPSTAPSHPKGMLDIVNIGLIFVEGFSEHPGNNVSFHGRFLQFADGTGSGSGAPINLQLVK